jgi:hypothetical protein
MRKQPTLRVAILMCIAVAGAAAVWLLAQEDADAPVIPVAETGNELTPHEPQLSPDATADQPQDPAAETYPEELSEPAPPADAEGEPHESLEKVPDDSQAKDKPTPDTIAPLNWLAEQGGREGWDPLNLNSGRDQDAASIETNALACLAYLAAGYCHREGEFQEQIAGAVRFLHMIERGDSRYGQGTNPDTRTQALVTLALVESWGMTGAAAIRGVAERTIQWMMDARSPDSGWGVAERDSRPDVITTAMVVMALKTAELAGIEFEKNQVYEEAFQFVDSLTTVQDGRVATSYSTFSQLAVGPGGWVLEHSLPICEASYLLVGTMTNSFTGATENKRNLAADKLVQAANLPAYEEGRIDLMYWWLGLNAVYAHGSDTHWKSWATSLERALHEGQAGYAPGAGPDEWVKEPDYGSFAAKDPWSNRGGRQYATALASLCQTTLELYKQMKR